MVVRRMEVWCLLFFFLFAVSALAENEGDATSKPNPYAPPMTVSEPLKKKAPDWKLIQKYDELQELNPPTLYWMFLSHGAAGGLAAKGLDLMQHGAAEGFIYTCAAGLCLLTPMIIPDVPFSKRFELLEQAAARVHPNWSELDQRIAAREIDNEHYNRPLNCRSGLARLNPLPASRFYTRQLPIAHVIAAADFVSWRNGGPSMIRNALEWWQGANAP